MAQGQSYQIPKRFVWEAYRRVKANGGAAGADGRSVRAFERKLDDNLYKIWNRMSSGSYLPPPVLYKEIPKSNGQKRKLGIPTVSDRIAQMAVVLYLQPQLDPFLHADSYGYRPGKSALQAVGATRQRCWKYDWVVDLDIKSFFDTIDHDLLMRAVRKHTQCKWVLLYVERWLKAPGVDAHGVETERSGGTPQGGVISPLLANLFLHYVFDAWMQKHFPRVPFERYADDIIVHCCTLKQATYVLGCIGKRMTECELTLHPERTKIVYCMDTKRKQTYENIAFDFLGYTLQPRHCRNSDGRQFIGFTPALSKTSWKRLVQKIRNWNLSKRIYQSMDEIAQSINRVVRGWINYYGAYGWRKMEMVVSQVEWALAHWARRKFKRLHNSRQRAFMWLRQIRKRNPTLFYHWAWLSR